ncbi:MAG: DNA polymerase I, partial [Muribaculaceae bacterium]|nr:DNA polymerase I [Muribaculaceae bacterium]
MEEKKLFLLDAYALIYRAYYALIRAPRVTSKGVNTSAIFGFCNTLDEVLRKENPQYIAVCFDPQGKTFRHEAYPEYKAQREKQPEDITLAVPYIKEILKAYHIPVVEVPGYEADDVIGTLAHRAASEGFTTYMMTPDKDYGQLVTDNVLMYRPALKGQGFEVRGPAEVCARYGLTSPHQVIDLLALEGDASDNVPGCPGVGEKTAVKLINEWGSVENLLDHSDELKGALKKKVQDNAEQIRFSKYLVTIRTDVPVDITLDSLIRKEPDTERLVEIYKELEFRTFIARLTARTIIGQAEVAQEPVAPAEGTMGSLFDMDGGDTAAAAVVMENAAFDDSMFTVADSPEKISDAVREALTHGTVGVHLAAAGDEPMNALFYGLSVAFGENSNIYIPLPSDKTGRREAMSLLQPLFVQQATTIVSHDVKRDMILLRREGVAYSAPYFDNAVAHYILKPEVRHNVEFVASDTAGYRMTTYTLSDLERKKLQAKPSDSSPLRAAEKARVALMLKPLLAKDIEEQGQTKLLTEIELPLVEVLASMEWEGARIDVDELKTISENLTSRLDGLEQRAYELAGEPFNISSPTQVGEILFGKMQIDPKAKKTKTGAWSTTEEILEKHRKDYEIVDIILKVRGLKKLLSTYVDALPKLINPITGKLHTSYNQTVTATGRISSTNPNLQNIPIRTDDGREIRRAFIPDDGCLMLSADYSQIELRLMADFSGDEGMVEAFGSGKDFH